MSRVAMQLDLPADKVRELNFYREGDLTPYKQVLDNCNVRRCWKQVVETSSFYDRKLAVDTFNKLEINTIDF